MPDKATRSRTLRTPPLLSAAVLLLVAVGAAPLAAQAKGSSRDSPPSPRELRQIAHQAKLDHADAVSATVAGGKHVSFTPREGSVTDLAHGAMVGQLDTNAPGNIGLTPGTYDAVVADVAGTWRGYAVGVTGSPQPFGSTQVKRSAKPPASRRPRIIQRKMDDPCIQGWVYWDGWWWWFQVCW